MAQNVAYGTTAADKVVRFFRLKSDHSIIQIPKGSGDTAIADIDDASFASKIIGNIQITPQDDGSNQIQMNCAAWGAELLDFISDYKNVEAAGDKTKFVGFHGEEWGGSGSSGTADQLIAVIHAQPDPDTTKIMALVFACNMEVANTGGVTIQPNQVNEVQLTLKQVKALQDIIIHTGSGGTPSVLNGTVVDFTSETTNIVIPEGTFKYHFPVAAV